jgi:Electron transfer DM13
MPSIKPVRYGLIALFSLLAALIFTTHPATAIPPTATIASGQNMPCMLAASVLQAAPFEAAEHPTVGQAQLVVENGQQYLEFDAAFQTDSGPDLFVLLHRQARPTRYQSSDYVNLGPLQSTTGQQRYLIPEGTDLTALRSAVIWCRQFSATFGFASFTP